LKLQLILLLAATLQVISLTATFANAQSGMASVYSTESAALRAVHDWIPAH
jgi:hypothetical protein